jgi:hypothetical protein
MDPRDILSLDHYMTVWDDDDCGSSCHAARSWWKGVHKRYLEEVEEVPDARVLFGDALAETIGDDQKQEEAMEAFVAQGQFFYTLKDIDVEKLKDRSKLADGKLKMLTDELLVLKHPEDKADCWKEISSTRIMKKQILDRLQAAPDVFALRNKLRKTTEVRRFIQIMCTALAFQDSAMHIDMNRHGCALETVNAFDDPGIRHQTPLPPNIVLVRQGTLGQLSFGDGVSCLYGNLMKVMNGKIFGGHRVSVHDGTNPSVGAGNHYTDTNIGSIVDNRGTRLCAIGRDTYSNYIRSVEKQIGGMCHGPLSGVIDEIYSRFRQIPEIVIFDRSCQMFEYGALMDHSSGPGMLKTDSYRGKVAGVIEELREELNRKYRNTILFSKQDTTLVHIAKNLNGFHMLEEWVKLCRSWQCDELRTSIHQTAKTEFESKPDPDDTVLLVEIYAEDIKDRGATIDAIRHDLVQPLRPPTELPDPKDKKIKISSLYEIFDNFEKEAMPTALVAAYNESAKWLLEKGHVDRPELTSLVDLVDFWNAKWTAMGDIDDKTWCDEAMASAQLAAATTLIRQVNRLEETERSSIDIRSKIDAIAQKTTELGGMWGGADTGCPPSPRMMARLAVAALALFACALTGAKLPAALTGATLPAARGAHGSFASCR